MLGGCQKPRRGIDSKNVVTRSTERLHNLDAAGDRHVALFTCSAKHDCYAHEKKLCSLDMARSSARTTVIVHR
jgi:hypothetical protein